MKFGYTGWGNSPFKQFLSHLKESHGLLYMSMIGISVIAKNPEALQSFSDQARKSPILDIYIKSGDVSAQKELASGFPLLLAQATISLWGHLEAFIIDFLAEWLSVYPGAYQASELHSLKTTVGDYELIQPTDKAQYVIGLLENHLRSKYKLGADRFESLLRVFDLDGELDKSLKDKIYELSRVRNVLIHRNGVADKKFVGECPFLKLNAGDRVIVTLEMYDRYFNSVVTYINILMDRVRDRYIQDAKARGDDVLIKGNIGPDAAGWFE